MKCRRCADLLVQPLTLLTKRLKLLGPKMGIEGASPSSGSYGHSCTEPVTVIAISTCRVCPTLDSDLDPLVFMASKGDGTFGHRKSLA